MKVQDAVSVSVNRAVECDKVDDGECDKNNGGALGFSVSVVGDERTTKSLKGKALKLWL